MNLRLRPWQLSLILLALCGLLFGILEWRRQTIDLSDKGLLMRMPFVDDGVQMYINVQTLRQAGLLDMLAGSKAVEETDYRKFVEGTGFDYREDLDAVFAAFRPNQSAFLLRGRFDWEQIRKYCLAQGAKCLNGYCDMEASRPGRFISLYMAHPRVLAIGVSLDSFLAYAMRQVRPLPAGFEMPGQPFWLSFSSKSLAQTDSLPAGTRAFASAVKGAERVTLGLGATDGKFEAEMRAAYKADAEAVEMKRQLDETTAMLVKFFARDKQTPNPNDLSGILTSGVFQQKGPVVVGRWPIQRDFLQALAEGKASE